MNDRHTRTPDQVFGDALELPTEERHDFVRRSCAHDPQLLAEVQSLLRSHDRAHELIRTDWFQHEARRVTDVRSTSEVGRRIGAYRLTRLIRTGGMGTVYLAERGDREFDHEVAIKLIKPGTATKEALRRFRTERQARSAPTGTPRLGIDRWDGDAVGRRNAKSPADGGAAR